LNQYAFIVLNLEKFWNRLCNQNRSGKFNHAFVRRGKVGPKNAEQLFFYVTHPRKDIQGYADFVKRITGDSKELWESFGHESLLNSFDEYQDFLQGRKTVTFIRFKNLREFPRPVTAEAMKQVIGIRRLPRMGMYISKTIADQLVQEGGV
jgi:predicted transcriptional regulator